MSNMDIVDVKSKGSDGSIINELHSGVEEDFKVSKRPQIVYSSPRAFARSFAARWQSLWTRQFILSLIAGQVVSLCITCTNVTTTELVSRGWTLSTTQNIFLYFTLFIVYTPYTIYQYGFKGWAKVILHDGWKYIILAACDVEGNFLVVKAYQYTDLLSCMLLDAWAIPVCLFFSWIYMRTRYHWTQLLGVFICIAGLGLLVASDELTQKSWEAISKGKGDAFMVAGATLYGFTNATEEFLVRRRPLYEVVGQLGMWGFIINGIQSSALEWRQMKEVPWTGDIIGLLMAFTAAMLILYTVAPLLYRLASSAYYNLSLLSSDFYGLLFGLFLYHYRPYWLYFIAFAIILGGLVTYFWHSAPEEQGVLDPKAPKYVNKRGDIAASDEEQAAESTGASQYGATHSPAGN
jgi:solute carrier family 35 protein F1/2